MMSTVTSDDTGEPAAPRAGADLRAARERLAWPIEDVSKSLRIRLSYLEALEEGRINLLPGSAYAVGFLRTYAKALGLDPDEIIRRFKAEAAEVNRRTELVFPAPIPQRGLPAGAIVLLSICLAVIAYAGWYRLSGEGRLPAETVTPVPQRLASLADQAVPLPAAIEPRIGRAASLAISGGRGARSAGTVAVAMAGSSAVASVSQPGASAAGSEPDAPAAGVASATAGTGMTVASSAPAVAGVLPQTVPGLSAAPVSPAMAAGPSPNAQPQSVSPTSAMAAPLPVLPVLQPPAAAAGPAYATPAPMPRLVLEATADAWLEVRDGTGAVLLNRVLHKGDSWPVPAAPNLELTTGNAGGTEIVLDGVVYPVPGGPGAVRRNLPLDAGLIRAGALASSGRAPGVSGVTQAAFARPATR